MPIKTSELFYSGRYKINLDKFIECSHKRPVREYESYIFSFEHNSEPSKWNLLSEESLRQEKSAIFHSISIFNVKTNLN